MAPFLRLHNAKCVIFIIFWRIFKKSVWKIVFSTKTAHYKNGAITNFVLCHAVKGVWKWRQVITSCLEYAKTWINKLHLKWRHFLNNIMQNIKFSLIFTWFSSKSAKKVTFSAQKYNEKTAPFSHSSNLSPRKCQRMLLRHVFIPQACSNVIWTNVFEMAPFFRRDCSILSKKTAKNEHSLIKNGAICVYERYCMLHLIQDVFIVFITFKKS